MAHPSSVVFAGIVPHPPIMVPEVGRDAIAEVSDSIGAMADLTKRVIASGAETVVIISPHAPLARTAFVAYDGPQLYADFANFRAPTATVHAPMDEELLNEITRAAAEESLVVMKIDGYDLDHGTAVPLYFLQRNGWQGNVVALGYSFLSNDDHIRFGQCVRRAIEKLERPVAFIASGDLSHRLKPDAPAGFNADAHYFDEEIVDAIDGGRTSRIVEVDQDMRRQAGECGYRSILVALGVAEGSVPSCEVISYEAPFGVGYLVAQLVAEPPAGVPLTLGDGRSDGQSIAGGPDSESAMMSTGSQAVLAQSGDPVAIANAAIPALARRVIETFTTTGKIIDPPESLSDLLSARAGCFVSIKTHEGDLRGCIGTVEPVKDTLAEEIITNAVSAATRDPRFPPVRKEELPNLKYSVDVLSAAEPTTLAELDPNVYGVVVEEESGSRRGLLLPNLFGIKDAAHQVEIASRKAGIKPGAEVKLFRFRSDRYSERKE
jgi:AmmeMemoRadiSam system protein A/AmmeMemoRadiSam system protein B